MNQIKTHYSSNGELLDTMEALKKSFEVVRCVNFILMKCIEFHRDGTHEETDYFDYSSLESGNIAAEAAQSNFINNDAFYVISKFISVEGYDLPLTLEIISHFSDYLSLDRFGNDLLIERISKDNANAYIDADTELYNADYLSLKLDDLKTKARRMDLPLTVIYFELDDADRLFASGNRKKQSTVLLAVASLIRSNISRRRGDFAAYLGHGVFAAVLLGLPVMILGDRLKLILENASHIPASFPVSLSAGAVSYFGHPADVSLRDIARANLAEASKKTVNRYVTTDMSEGKPL